MRKYKRKEPVLNLRRPRLNSETKDLLVALLVRNPRVFAAFQAHIKPEHFGDYERRFTLIWSLALALYAQFGHLPDKAVLRAEFQTAIDADPGYLTEPEAAEALEYIDYIYNASNFEHSLVDDPSYIEWGIQTGKQFLEEQIAAQFKALGADNKTTPANLNAAADAMMTQVAAIAAISTDNETESFPVEWGQQVAIDMWSTGLSFLDDFLGGGQANGEVYGLLGPYGSCKSTLAYMLGAEAVAKFAEEAKADPSQPRKLVFMVSYEDILPMMRQRTLGYAAKIKRSVLERIKDHHQDLSRSTHLRDYEKRLFRHKLVRHLPVPGEFERAERVIPDMNNHMIFLDMTGHTAKGVGGGYIPEIANLITSRVQQHGNAVCGLVIVDYVGAMVRRHISVDSSKSNDDLRHLITGAPLSAKTAIATRYNCPVWLLHQLSGAANKFSESHLAGHADSAESKSFAENLDFAFVIGKPSQPDNVARFGCTKHRRTAGQEASLIQVQGDLYRVVCVDDKFRLDTTQRRIMRLDEYNCFRGAAAKTSGNHQAATTTPADVSAA